ncbi:MAG: glycoside hydrolase family 9 protein [Lachnospiraceae bacterium]|nr:glycoside hydrolase family 9 protein [Lachnospiraceae bacterium]
MGDKMAVLCNQVGYLPQGRKTAVLTVGEHFKVIQAEPGQDDGQVIMEGDARDAGVDAASGDHVYVADFSRITQEGTYYVQNESGERSHCFRIGQDVYRALQKDMTKALYYQRCGCGLQEAYAGVYEHPVCHAHKAVLWTDHSVEKEVSGGWHDAGDYGRYISPAAVAVGHLLYAYLLFPDSFKDSLNIPESGNGVPDVLNECRYELEWMLKMQDEEGGAYHKLTSERHADFIMPEEDHAQFYLFSVSSMATADYAASMALASRVYRAYDGDFADRLYEAAVRAYGWLERYPEYVGFRNPESCNTGEYDDVCDLDERLWAAAEMLVTTGEQKYQEQVDRLLKENLTKTDFGWTDVSGFAALAILTDESHRASAESVADLRGAVLVEADRLVAVAEQSGYGVAMEPEDYIWGSNMVVLNRGMLLVLAALVIEQEDRKNAYEQTALAQLDYLLGMNAVDYSYVTGYGDHACRNPHNRPTECDGIELPMPGWVSGGPFKTPCDEVGREHIPEGTPPMKCYLDHAACYSLNEITIYWNTPAIFVAAYFNGK